MDPNSFGELSAASTVGESVDVRVDPGSPEDPQQIQPGVCPECYTCPACESIYRDFLYQNPSNEPNHDISLPKSPHFENVGYDKVIAPQTSPGFRLAGRSAPPFLPRVATSGGNEYLSSLDQSSIRPQISGQVAAAPSFISVPSAGDPGGSPSLEATELSSSGNLYMCLPLSTKEGSMNAQGYSINPQPSDYGALSAWDNGLGDDLQSSADVYASNPKPGSMDASSPARSVHFQHWNPHSTDPGNSSFESRENLMTDESDNSQCSITSRAPSTEPSTPRFYCGTCNRSYKRKDDLNRHAKNHLGFKPHKCPFPQCPSGLKGFVRNDHLIQHVKKKHPDPDASQEK